MKTQKLVIDRELFDQLCPKSNTFVPQFQPGEEIVLIGIDWDNRVKWGKEDVPQIILDNDRKIPAPVIFGMVVNRDGLIKNEGTKEECVDFLNNTLADVLKANKTDQIELPSSIKVIKKINKGVLKTSITSENKKQMYKDSYYGGEGVEFEEGFKNLEFIPSIFKSATGVLRNNSTTLIALD